MNRKEVMTVVPVENPERLLEIEGGFAPVLPMKWAPVVTRNTPGWVTGFRQYAGYEVVVVD